MALTDIKARTSKPTEKQYKLTDANGMHLLVHTNDSKWSKDAVERQMSHQERNSVRASYFHKAEHLDERRLMLQVVGCKQAASYLTF